MIIIQTQAEEKFIESLEIVRKAAGNKRCLWIEFPEEISLTLTHLQAAINVICKQFVDDSCQLFVFGWQGMAMLGNGLQIEQLEQLQADLEANLDVEFKPKGAQLFDLGAQWGRVSLLGEDALARKRQAIAQKQQAEKDKRRQQILTMPFDPVTVQRMHQVRAARTGIEILLVEDDLFSRKMVRGVLEKNYRVTTADKGLGALKSYVTTGPDIIFLDIELPDVTGHDILKRIMQIDPSAYVIMLSGNGDRQNIMKAIEAGAKGFIAKPFTKDKLMQYIQKCPQLSHSA